MITDRKEILIYLIENKGECLDSTIDCSHCNACVNMPLYSCNPIEATYKEAIRIYSVNYNIEDIVEMLI